MKLSKQERIAVLIIAVIIIIVLGVIFFIVPKFNEIGVDSDSLVNKQAELAAAVERANTKEQLKQDIITAYDEGRSVADMFFDEMQPYEADDEIRAFIDYCRNNPDEEKRVQIAVDSIAIGAPSVGTLGVNFYTEPEVTYDLKTYATQGQEPSEEEVEAAVRQALLQASLSSTQTVGAIDINFTVTTLNDEDMLKFVDIVNDYVKEENGEDVRKAIRLSSGYSVTYSEVEKKYGELAAELLEDSTNDAIAQLEKDTGEKIARDDNPAPANPEGNGEEPAAPGQENGENGEDKDDEDKDTTFEGNTRQMGVTLTLYSIERMQDPTDQLAAQDAL